VLDRITCGIKWYHVVGLVLGLTAIAVVVLWLTRRDSQPGKLPINDDGDII